MLLITTPLQVLTFDLARREVGLLRTGDGEYFGLTWNDAGVFLGHSGMDNEALVGWEDYLEPPRGFLSSAGRSGPRARSRALLLQPHQIEAIDRHVVATNTGKNCLSVFEPESMQARDVKLDGVERDLNPDGRTGSHFNSVHRHDDRLWVVAHNFELPSSLWELTWPGLEVVATHPTGAGWAHNVWIGEHGKVVCDSKHGALLAVDSGETIWRADEPGVITRGLAVVGDRIYVGRSEFGSRGERKHNDGGLWVLDRSTLTTLERHVFPGSGCVNELRAIHGRDECHVAQPFDPAWLEGLRRRTFAGSLGYELRRRPRAHARYLSLKRRLSREPQPQA